MKSEIIYEVTEEEEEKKREDHNEDIDGNEKEEEEEKEEEMEGGKKYQKCLKGCLGLSFFVLFFYFWVWICPLVLLSISSKVILKAH